MEHGGCYIFLSHASANINIVRRIRNEFESLGQNPIAFHLRCLDENYKGRDEELWNLIYREIDAREWIVYCQSPEAKESDNVQKEYAYIKQAGKDKIWLGGRALAAGGGGMAAGEAFLTLAGPVGWAIAGVALVMLM